MAVKRVRAAEIIILARQACWAGRAEMSRSGLKAAIAAYVATLAAVVATLFTCVRTSTHHAPRATDDGNKETLLTS